MIPHNQPSLGLHERIAAENVLRSAWVAQGPEVEKFEQGLCKFFGMSDGHTIVVSSGSAALYLALWALDAKNMRIGLPVYSCAALRNAISMVGGESVYLDCAVNSPNVDLSHADDTNLDILIAPSMYGIPANLPSVRKYKIVEDLAQSMGALVDGKPIGLRGNLGICSFYATKMMTSGGQGGAVISRDKSLIDRIRDFREFDCRSDALIRFNFQMTDLQAAIGRVQLERLPSFIAKRQKLFSIYQGAGLDLVDDRTSGVQPVRYRAVVRCDSPQHLISALAAHRVKSIIPVEKYELLDNTRIYANANALTGSTVSLPIYPDLDEHDAARIASIARENV